jgi:hypothetical protein
MSEYLQTLIDKARQYRTDKPLSEDETNRQVRSFAFGNTNLENSAITKADIDRAMESLRVEQHDERTSRT